MLLKQEKKGNIRQGPRAYGPVGQPGLLREISLFGGEDQLLGVDGFAVQVAV